MNNYQNSTPPALTRHLVSHLPPPHHPVSLHHVAHAAPPSAPHHHAQHAPPATAAVAAASVGAASIPQPLISNSLAIRQEIQRFESVHPSIYAIYDLIDLLPMPDAQIAQQIRDHVVCIEAISPEQRGWIVNGEAKKRVKHFLNQMQCGWPEYGIPPLAPYTNSEMQFEVARSVVNSLLELLQFRLDGLDQMEIKKLKITFTFSKTVKFHFNFKELLATASTFSTDTFIDMLQQLGLSVRYEGVGPFEFALENLSIQGQFKYKMPIMFGSIKIYKFQVMISLGGVRSNVGGILGDGKANEFLNDQVEYLVPAFINGHQTEISDYIEQIFVPRVNEHFKGKKIWSLIFNSSGNSKCYPTPAPW